MRILIAVDRSEYSEIVLEHGLDQAVRLAAGEIHVVTAVEKSSEISGARSFLDAAVADLVDVFRCADRTMTLHIRRGAPATVIAAMVEELHPDLLVVGRFHVPSAAEPVSELPGRPTLVVGIDGHVLEPQCPACQRTRAETEAEVWFCEAHAGGRIPDLVTRIPPSWSQPGSRLW